MTGTDRLRAWLIAGAESVTGSRELLDAINVFPIADSDTGTNLHLTLAEGNRAVALLPSEASHADVVAAFTRGSLLGARGNSGVILAQYMNAFLLELDARGGFDAATGDAIAAALERAAAAAHDAVGEPVDGTILTVADSAALSAREAAGESSDPLEVTLAAVAIARQELARTHEVLDVAREAGVVDAGAAGLVLQLEALAATLGGAAEIEMLPDVPWEVDEPYVEREGAACVVAAVGAHDHAGTGAFEVMFVALTDTASAVGDGDDDEPAESLKSALKAAGDAVAVTGAGGLWQAHVHTDHPDRALDVALRFRATQAVVRDIAATTGADRADAGVVALTTAPGLAAELARSGAAVLVVPEPSFVEPLDLRRVVQDASDTRAVVVAGAPALAAAVRALPASDGMPVVDLVAATTEPELLSAVAAFVICGPVADPAPSMRAAVARTRTSASTVDALADDLERLAEADTEVLTVILGRGLDRAVAESALRRLVLSAPGAEVHVFEGRQATPTVILGAESGV